MNKKLLLKHLLEVEESFPKLHFKWSDDLKSAILHGDLDICDKKGAYWDTFNIMVVVGSKYPFSVPVLIERSEKIPREDSRHISKEGVCCIDMDHKLLHEVRKGININEFLKNRVYPFFSNQLFFEENEEYANGEWDHQFDGIKQFYSTELNLKDPKLIIDVLTKILTNNLPARNDKCICGSTKHKLCHHMNSIEFLKQLPKRRLTKDLEGFEAL